MAAVARDDDEYDLEDGDYSEENAQAELERQRRILAQVSAAA